MQTKGKPQKRRLSGGQLPSRSELNIDGGTPPPEDPRFPDQPPVAPGEFATDADVKNSLSDVAKPEDPEG
jgi:hypothetical protein